MSTQIKYLKDENGEVFSPITSSEAVMMRDNTTLKQNVYPVIHINKKINITAANTWVDTGIVGTDFKYDSTSLESENKMSPSNGAYVMMLVINQNTGSYADVSYQGKGGLWQETGVAVIANYSGSTNSNDASEISVSWVGHASNGRVVKLRWARVTGNDSSAKLQISSTSLWGAECNLNFYFRKLI